MGLKTAITPIGVSEGGAEASPEALFSDFKDTQGRFRTLSLFYESRHPDYKSYFTTKKYDHEGHISLYRKYMEIADPTEYQVAQRLFGSWDHWKALNASKWFTEMVTPWREELKVKLESERYHEMKKVAKSKGPAGPAASKWLAERYGEKKLKFMHAA